MRGFGATGVLWPRLSVMLRSPRRDIENNKDALLRDQRTHYDKKIPRVKKKN